MAFEHTKNLASIRVLEKNRVSIQPSKMLDGYGE